MNSNNRVYNSFRRPEKELIEKFRDIPVANIDDCMGRLAAIDESIKPVGRSGLVGPALTIKVPAGDNLMMHYAMDLAQEGDVLVIDAGGCTNRAIFGGLMASYLMTKKIAGIVIDGAIRDSREIEEMGLPVYARGVTPNGPWKNGPGEVNTVIHVGGCLVAPGDIVVADQDGVLFVPKNSAAEVLERVSALMAGEAAVMQGIQKNGTMDRPWVMEKLKAAQCEFYDRWD